MSETTKPASERQPKYSVWVTTSPGCGSPMDCNTMADVTHFVAYQLREKQPGETLQLKITRNY